MREIFISKNVSVSFIIKNFKHLKLKVYSIQFSGSVVSDSLQPHESQYARPPCRSVVSCSVALLKEDFPGGSVGRVCLQCKRPRFDPWVGTILWRRKWQPTPVFLPGKSHGQRSLVGYSLCGRKK